MDLMVQKHKLEFYPELQLQLIEQQYSSCRQLVATIQSQTSFRVLSHSHFFKRQFMCWDTTKKQKSKNNQIIMVKKYSDYKGQISGVKRRIRTLPAVTLNNKLIISGSTQNKRDTRTIFLEILGK